jgi:N4-gp56 family major capsid protein
MWSPNLSKVLRMAVQPLTKFRQFSDIKDAAVQGKGMGEAFHWNVYSDVATQGTTLTEGVAMPTTNFVITQGTMTVTEMGNSVPYSSKLDDLSEQPVKEIISKVLKNDAKKAFDTAAEAQFRLTPLRVVPTGGTSTSSVTLTTNGTAAAANAVALGKNHVKSIVDIMKERNVPPYMQDDYIALAHPTTFRQVKNDLEQVHQYTSEGFSMILNGEIGRYESVRFVEQTNISKRGFASGASNWAYFFGADTVAEGIVIPEEMRGMIPGDYGRQRGVAWYYLGGFGVVHTNPLQSRIVMWDSTT